MSDRPRPAAPRRRFTTATGAGLRTDERPEGRQIRTGVPAGRDDGGTGEQGRSPVAERLLTAVSPLWPTSTMSVRRVAGGTAGATWLVLPSMRQPILLVPPGSRGATAALQPSGTGRGSGRMRALAALQRTQVLRRLPLARLVVDEPLSPGSVHHAVERVVPGATDLVVRLGRRRFNRALVLMVLGPSGEPLAFVKAARDDGAREVLRREHAHLDLVNHRAVPGLRTPVTLGHVESEALDYLFMTALGSAVAGAPRPVPVAQMQALAGLGSGHRDALREQPVLQHLAAQAAGLVDPAQRGWTTHAVEALASQLGHVEVTEAAWHGDWVSWNMSRADGEVQLWDWEHFDLRALRGWDHVHFLAQDLRVRAGTTPAAEDRWLVEAHDALEQDWSMAAAERTAVIRAYLIAVNVRYLSDRQQDPLGTADRRGWARQLLERLEDGAGHEAA